MEGTEAKKGWVGEGDKVSREGERPKRGGGWPATEDVGYADSDGIVARTTVRRIDKEK